jgi:hypothetical protein
MSDDTRVEALVRYLVESLVDDPSSVQIVTVDEPDSLTFEVRVAPDDMGKVIGRQGRIVKSIRTIARAAGASGDKSVEVEVLD